MNSKSLETEITETSTPLRKFSDLNNFIEQIKDKKIVMLGESSHGTQEFYEWRQFISDELIKKHNFNFIAVEGDWPPCESLNRFIHADSSEETIKVMREFSRWPTWMWSNTIIMNLMDDLREWNQDAETPVGFHGLDVYSLYESMDEVLRKLKEFDTDLALRAKGLYSCFDSYRHDEKAYARSLFQFPEGCVSEVAKALANILKRNLEDGDKVLDVVQNAKVVKNAVNYYHAMISQEEDSWNVRDRHMLETLEALFKYYGPESKGIIWAHNTHIGDYRATDMLINRQINIGGLARQKYGKENVSLIGFTTYEGEVIASRAWDGPIEKMKVPQGKITSLEFALHKAIPKVGHDNYYLDFNNLPEESALNDLIGHRAIGVVYYPEHEQRGNYVPTIPAKRYDALIFLNETNALTPLNVKFTKEKIPETFPFGNRV